MSHTGYWVLRGFFIEAKYSMNGCHLVRDFYRCILTNAQEMSCDKEKNKHKKRKNLQQLLQMFGFNKNNIYFNYKNSMTGQHIVLFIDSSSS